MRWEEIMGQVRLEEKWEAVIVGSLILSLEAPLPRTLAYEATLTNFDVSKGQ